MLLAKRGIIFPKSDYTCNCDPDFLVDTEIYNTGLIQFPYCTVCSVSAGPWGNTDLAVVPSFSLTLCCYHVILEIEVSNVALLPFLMVPAGRVWCSYVQN